jgi:hypothetical protein
MPTPIIEKLNATIGGALQSAEVREKIRGLDLNVFATPANKLRPLILGSTEVFERLIKTANIKPID